VPADAGEPPFAVGRARGRRRRRRGPCQRRMSRVGIGGGHGTGSGRGMGGLSRPRCADRGWPGYRAWTAPAQAASSASTVTRTTGSVPEGRRKARPRPSTARCASAERRLHPRILHRRGAVGQPHVDRRSAAQAFAGPPAVPAASAAALQHLQHLQRADDAVAGAGAVQAQQVAGGLAAEVAAVLDHAAGARGGRPPSRARSRCRGRQRLLEAVVGHQRADHRAAQAAGLLPVAGQHVQQVVAIAARAVARRRTAPGRRRRRRRCPGRPRFPHARGQRPGMGRADPVVDVQAAGIHADRSTWAPSSRSTSGPIW
jgi:hypothetical protein